MTTATRAARPSSGHDSTGLDSISETLAVHGLALQRSWPRDESHLLLEAVGIQGTVAGQWFDSPDRAAQVASTTTGAYRVGSIVLQPGGADRRLPSLSALLREPGTVLVAHRPERRAVLRQTTVVRGDPRTVYTKLVRRDRLSALARSAMAAAALPLRTPRVLAADDTLGSLTTEALPGVPLHDLLSGKRLLSDRTAVEACRATGAVLASLHRLAPPADLPAHTAADERRVVARWERLADSYGVAPAFANVPAAAKTYAESDERSLIHRDFHDRQVLVDTRGDVGVVDFDLMAVGDPMLDLANLLVHLDLRARQGVLTDAAPLRAAVLDGYQPTTEQLARVPGFEATTWARLSAVYAFRRADGQT